MVQCPTEYGALMKAPAIKLGILLIIAPSAGRDKRDDACNGPLSPIAMHHD
jgi:hypothetical protein